MIEKKHIIILFLITLLACKASQPEYLPNLTIENKSSSKLIENRVPDYGIDGKDGCIVLNEISMNIIDLKKDFIKGQIFDSETNEPLMNANVNLIIENYQKIDNLNLNSDSKGLFKKEFKGKLTRIEVNYISYRDLKINLEKA